MSDSQQGVYRKIQPIPGPEAFEELGRSARFSQAAFVLSAGAGVGGAPERVEFSERFPLPALDRLAQAKHFTVAQAASRLDVDTAEYVAGFTGVIPSAEGARLARDLYDRPQPQTAAALVEASLHSPSQVVRTAAAAAALDTTGPRDDVVAQLVASTRAKDETTRALARVALARSQPGNEALVGLSIARPRIRERSRESDTAVLTHGTFASRAVWWRPSGTFYAYLNGLTPSLHMHDESFQWSGAYSVEERDLDADDLAEWVGAEGLRAPDFFAHSHGVTVANLATQRGLKLSRLVMLSLPVHDQWLPDLAKVDQVIDVRVRFDLVIIADRGGQRLPAGMRASPNVTEHVNGWFDHGLSHDPQYWEHYDLPSAL
jgi:hypothetical protein